MIDLHRRLYILARYNFEGMKVAIPVLLHDSHGIGARPQHARVGWLKCHDGNVLRDIDISPALFARDSALVMKCYRGAVRCGGDRCYGGVDACAAAALTPWKMTFAGAVHNFRKNKDASRVKLPIGPGIAAMPT